MMYQMWADAGELGEHGAAVSWRTFPWGRRREYKAHWDQPGRYSGRLTGTSAWNKSLVLSEARLNLFGEDVFHGSNQWKTLYSDKQTVCATGGSMDNKGYSRKGGELVLDTVIRAKLI